MGSFVDCPEDGFTVMASICCKNDQVNSEGECANQCQPGQVMNENRVCENCPVKNIVNAAGDRCLDDCSDEGQIINSAGIKCLLNCTAEGEVENAGGTACLFNCTAGGETADSNGDNKCDSNCSDMELILNSLGDK